MWALQQQRAAQVEDAPEVVVASEGAR
jgi:ATP-binding cassette, subfamily B, heavy metal transporter